MILPLKIKHLNTCFLKYSAWSISSTVSFYSALGIMILLLFAPKGASSQDTLFYDFVTNVISTNIMDTMNCGDGAFLPYLNPNTGDGCQYAANPDVTLVIKVPMDSASYIFSPGQCGSMNSPTKIIIRTPDTDTMSTASDNMGPVNLEGDTSYTVHGNYESTDFTLVSNKDSMIILFIDKGSGAFTFCFAMTPPCNEPIVKDTSFVICSGGQIGLDLKELVTDSAGASSVSYTWGAVIDNGSIMGDEVMLWSRADTRIDTTLHNISNDYKLVEYQIAAYTDGNTNCADTASVYVTVFDTLQKPTLFPDSIKVCRFGMDEQIISSATGGSGEFSFEWKCVICPSGTIGTLLDDNTIYNPVFNASAGIGDYDLRLVVTDTLCMVSDSIDLHAEVVALPSADAGDDKDICSGSSTQLGIAEVTGYSYFWAPSVGLSSTTVAQPLATPEDSTTYYLTVIDPNGCASMDTVEVNVTYQVLSMNVDARAVCSPDDSAQYHIDVIITSPMATFDFNVSINGVVTVQSADSVRYGPYPYSDTSNLINEIDTIIVSSIAPNIDCSVTLEVAETYCGFGNDTTVCNYNTLPADRIGSIMAQSEPGTFVAGGSSGQRQLYILAEANSPSGDSVLAWNKTGYFSGLSDGMYKVVAMNYPDTTTLSAFDLFSTGGELADTADFNSFCFDFCSADYTVSCPCLQPTVRDTSLLLCSGEPLCLNLSDLVLDDGGATLVEYSWGAVIDNGSIIGDEVASWSREDTKIDTSLMNISSDYQLVEYRVAVYTSGNVTCADTASVYVTVYDTLQKPKLFPDTITVCQNSMDEQITSSISGGSGEFSFEWKCVICPFGTIGTLLNDITIYNPVFNSSAITEDYTLRLVVMDTLCMVSDSIDLIAEVRDVPAASAGEDWNICEGSSAQLGTAEEMGYSYLWEPATGLSSTTVAQPIATPEDSTIYYLTVTDLISGCTSTDTVEVNVSYPFLGVNVDAHAVCSPDDSAQYHIDIIISSPAGTFPYDISINGMTAVSQAVDSARYGPFSYSDTSNLINEIDTITITSTQSNVSCSVTLEVAETYCGFGNDLVECNYDLPFGMNGSIMAQSEPGTFVAGGSSGQRQLYILAEANGIGGDSVITYNKTGYFSGLDNGIYKVVAFNYPDTTNLLGSNLFQTGGELSDTVDFNSFCFAFCSADYEINCIPEHAIGVSKMLTEGPGDPLSDGSHTVTYELSVVNQGPLPLYDVQLFDTLTQEFGTWVIGSAPGADGRYIISQAPSIIYTSPGSMLTSNSDFNGSELGNNTSLFSLNMGDVLQSSDTVTISFEIRFIPIPGKVEFVNTAIATGDFVENGVSDNDIDDISNDGPEVDEDDDDISDEMNDNTPTVFYIVQENIPTLGEWGIIICALLLMIVGVVKLREESVSIEVQNTLFEESEKKRY